MQTIDKHLIVAGLARNCAHSLPRLLKASKKLSKRFRFSDFIFLENDSTDRSKDILRKFAKRNKNCHIEFHDNIGAEYARRTERLAFLRNRLIEIAQRETSNESDTFLLLLDLDGVNKHFDVNRIASFVEKYNGDWAGLFPTQSLNYYDLWALRHPIYCPYNITERIRNRPKDMSSQQAVNHYFKSLKFTLPKDLGLVEVESAFGGMGLYKLSAVRGCIYVGLDDDGYEICEHVAFNTSIRENGGKLFIDSGWINSDGAGSHLTAKKSSVHRRIDRKISKFQKTHKKYSRRFLKFLPFYTLHSQKNTENYCRFVSSRGILKSTKTHVLSPKSGMKEIPAEFASRLKGDVDTLYMTVEMLPLFVEHYLTGIKTPFTLITGDSDISVSESRIPKEVLTKILSNSFLTRWFAQNLEISHPKTRHLPVGLDYHTLYSTLCSGDKSAWGDGEYPIDQERQLVRRGYAAGPLSLKRKKAFSNWHFKANRGQRKDCIAEFPEEFRYFQPKFLKREASWEMNSQFAFTLSPFGNGLDCHRTWEALLLGTIPVVKSSPLDTLFEDLPVVILDRWDEFTKERMEAEIKKAMEGNFHFHKLELRYWQQRIREEKPSNEEPKTFEEFRKSLGRL